MNIKELQELTLKGKEKKDRRYRELVAGDTVEWYDRIVHNIVPEAARSGRFSVLVHVDSYQEAVLNVRNKLLEDGFDVHMNGSHLDISWEIKRKGYRC